MLIPFTLLLCLASGTALAAESAGTAAAAAALERSDYAVAHEFLLPLAESGNAEAQYALGHSMPPGKAVR